MEKWKTEERAVIRKLRSEPKQTPEWAEPSGGEVT